MEGDDLMADRQMGVVTARFIGMDVKLGREIMTEPRYARYRNWLGKEVRVDLSTAEFMPDSATETRVEITLPWGETAVVRSAHITGLTTANLEVMHRAALDQRFPTTRVPTASKREEAAPPA